jgi:histidine triad (HIT) family protein
MSSIFTQIISGEIPGYKIYEDEYVCAILDINPIQKGHVLVIPKQEADQLFELDEVMFDKMMHRVRYMAQVMKGKLDCKRVCVFVEGYGVPHVHVHLVPTNKPEDFDKALVYKATEAELLEMQKMLQS